jgi:hypothetical protein
MFIDEQSVSGNEHGFRASNAFYLIIHALVRCTNMHRLSPDHAGLAFGNTGLSTLYKHRQFGFK